MMMGQRLLDYLSIFDLERKSASTCVARNKRPVYDHYQLTIPPRCLDHTGNTFSNP
jgi:hypothetical protein